MFKEIGLEGTLEIEAVVWSENSYSIFSNTFKIHQLENGFLDMENLGNNMCSQIVHSIPGKVSGNAAVIVWWWLRKMCINLF